MRGEGREWFVGFSGGEEGVKFSEGGAAPAMIGGFWKPFDGSIAPRNTSAGVRLVRQKVWCQLFVGVSEQGEWATRICRNGWGGVFDRVCPVWGRLSARPPPPRSRGACAGRGAMRLVDCFVPKQHDSLLPELRLRLSLSTPHRLQYCCDSSKA